MNRRSLLGWPTWIGVVVENLDTQRRFWADVLGVDEDHSGNDFVSFRIGDNTFELIERSDEPEYDRVRFQVGFEVGDIQEAHDELVSRGLQGISPIYEDEASPWAYFRDQEGNVFEIKERPRAIGT